MNYRVKELAELAGVSVRALHHYDAIGLLSPARRSPSGYRLYGPDDLLRLQQILFYRELEMPLDGIARELGRPDFDPAAALVAHRARLEEKLGRLRRLVATIDATLARLGGEEDELKPEELYEGFPKETAERWEREAAENWGDTDAYRESRKRVGRMSKERWAEVKAEGGAVDEALADAMRRGVAPESDEALALVERKVAHLRNFYEPSREMVKGLGEMYVQHPEFRALYEKQAPGLAEYLRDAMAAWAASGA